MRVEVYLNAKITTRDQALAVISNQAEKLGIINPKSSKAVYDAFIHRENETTTGLEDGFAIPHAVSDEIKTSAIFYVKSANEIDWQALDGKPTKYIIALFIPAKDRASSHMEVLSKIAVGLLDNEFKEVLMSEADPKVIKAAFEKQIADKPSDVAAQMSDNSQGYKFLGLTACPVGVAHTYIAAEKIEAAAKKLGHTMKVETHGSVGPKNVFTDEDIANADYILIASDIGLDLTRFAGKKILVTNTKEALKSPEELVKRTIQSATVTKAGESKVKDSNEPKEKKSFVVQHLLAGVSYLIPFIIFGGLLIAIALGIANAIYGSSATPEGTILYYILQFGSIAFTVMIGILAAFIANSIAGRAAIAPAMIVAMVANSTNLLFPITGAQVATPMGFIGAIIFGIVIGYNVKWVNTWLVHKNVSALLPIFIIPVLITLFWALIASFVIGAPIGFVMDQIGALLSSAFSNEGNVSVGGRVGIGIGLGFVLGAMIGFDMGGPINKIAFVLAVALLGQGIRNPMGIVAAAIPVAPIGMGVASQIYRKRFNTNERGLGISAIIMGFVGISEGAIPFAVADPKRVFPANILGSAVAGAIAGALGVTSAVGHGGPWIGIVGGISGNLIGDTSGVQLGVGILFFFIAIIIGSAVTVLTYGLLAKVLKDKVTEEVKETKVMWHHHIGNAFASFKAGVKGSALATNIKTHKKHYAFGVLVTLALATLIIGAVLLGNNFGNVIEAFRTSTSTGITTSNWGQANVYGWFLVIFAFVTTLLTFIYSFTVFPRKPKVKVAQTSA